MVSYIQKTNRNSFTRRFKKYKRLRSDIWGRIALANRNDAISTFLKFYANRDLTYRTRHLGKRKRKALSHAFRNSRNWKPFTFTITEKAEPIKGRDFKYRSSLKILRKKFLLFYNIRLKSKSLRKVMRARSFRSSTQSKLDKAYIECRPDVLLYRCNLSENIQQSRMLIRKGQAFMIGPKAPKDNRFFTTTLIKKPYHLIPTFFLFRLSPAYSLIRKTMIRNLIWSRIKFFSLPPTWIMPNHTMMLFLLLQAPSAVRVRYVFKGRLTTFLGAAIYY
jgi:hypothetical protein